jgi:hypothetical protein
MDDVANNGWWVVREMAFLLPLYISGTDIGA